MRAVKQGAETFGAKRTIQLISGMPYNEIETMLEDLSIYAAISYIRNGKILIPFIGEITLNNIASPMQCDFKPSDFLKTCIGQIENGGEDTFEKTLARRFKPLLNFESN
jgi:hypothetical protein